MSCKRALNFDQWKTFSENYKPMMIWLWLFYKFTENYCRLWFIFKFIRKRLWNASFFFSWYYSSQRAYMLLLGRTLIFHCLKNIIKFVGKHNSTYLSTNAQSVDWALTIQLHNYHGFLPLIQSFFPRFWYLHHLCRSEFLMVYQNRLEHFQIS